MTVGARMRRLTRVLRQLERGGWTIRQVAPMNGEAICTETALDVLVTCDRPPADGQGGTGLRELTPGSEEYTVQTLEVTPSPGGGQLARLRISITSTGQADNTPVRLVDQSPPLHRNPAQLRALYREHASFVEMAGSVEADISAETIRRYMIEHGIHEPGQQTDGATPEILADGYGLPPEFDSDAFASAVADANTLYDVQRALDLGRERTVRLLEQFDLLDLVVGRLETAADREVRRETIERRLRGIEG